MVGIITWQLLLKKSLFNLIHIYGDIMISIQETLKFISSSNHQHFLVMPEPEIIIYSFLYLTNLEFSKKILGICIKIIKKSFHRHFHIKVIFWYTILQNILYSCINTSNIVNYFLVLLLFIYAFFAFSVLAKCRLSVLTLVKFYYYCGMCNCGKCQCG